MHSCKCASGYVRGANDSCEVLQSENKILMIASDSEFRILPGKFEDVIRLSFISTPSMKIKVFDVFIVTTSDIIIFWIDSYHKVVYKLKVSSLPYDFDDLSRRRRDTESEIAILTDLENPIALAVDWIIQRLYVIDDDTQKLISTDFNGKNRVFVTHTGPKPLDIAIYPQTGTIFWSTKENGIYSFEIHNPKKRIISENIQWPTGLTIDYLNKRLYWSDHRKGSVESTLLDGSDRHVINQFINISKPNKIDVFENFLYVTLFDNKILKLNKYGYDNGSFIHPGYFKSTDLLLIHPMKQNSNFTNYCRMSSCGSKAICMISSSAKDNYVCVCPENMIKQFNNITREISCHEQPDYLKCDLPCNSGTCKIVEGKKVCQCPVYYYGIYCEHYLCSGYCQNHGICQINSNQSLTNNSIKCQCTNGWTGDRCEIAVTDCQTQCHNGATCIASNDKISCICPSGFTGENCENCLNLSCSNGGVCRKSKSDVSRCECLDGYSGKFCEIDSCADYCYNNGNCSVSLMGLQCKCPDQYSGPKCEKDECEGFCYNDGVCSVSGNSKKCNCSWRYTGRKCNIDLCDTGNPPKSKYI